MTRRGARSLDDIELPPWSILAFTDVHVAARTLGRVLDVLRLVREEALRRRVDWVVFVGDFWDARGVLNVRQLDAILDELHRWRDAQIRAVFIPGNHDQVSVNGRIHGIRFAEAFPNITVATERVLWPERKLAFLPWREDPSEQSALFDLPGDGWTIFAHAEVAGASTNHRHVAPGRVSLAQIHTHARACYVGHYHKRQLLGDRTWYIGSPFEHNFGEMGDPKGLALISSARTEPEWISLPGFPRHHRVTYGVPFDVSAIGPTDIVEAFLPREKIGSDDAARFVEAIPAGDVRPLPAREEEKTGAPAFALTLDQAIDAYVDDLALAAETGAGMDLVEGMTTDGLKGLARAILAELPEARAIVPMTPACEVLSVEADQFCALGGRVALDLEKRGLVLLKGKVGAGKTALSDAITWCLTGQTAPRKAGVNGSTFRGDEVIHDDAPACRVLTRLRLADGREVHVTREKKRGKGATVEIEGIDLPDGISDYNALLSRVTGLDYDLWRACVSLGQGAVGNFVTDADKRRKEVLSVAFGLTACPLAVDFVRKRIKPLRFQADKVRLDLTTMEARLEELRRVDYSAQLEAFEQRRDAAKEAARQTGEQAKATITSCEEHLATEAGWLARKTEHEAALEALVRQLAAVSGGTRASDLERELGGIQAERSMLERDLAKAQRDAAALQAKLEAGPVPCPTCGKPMEATHAEAHVAEKGHEAERIQRGIRTLDTKLTNIRVQLDASKRGSEGQREALEQQITASRQALATIGNGLSQFTRFRANLDEAKRRLGDARAAWEREDKAVNPFVAQQAQALERLMQIEQQITEQRAIGAQLGTQLAALEFWDEGFGPKGIPVLVLRTAIYEIETHANRFLGQLLAGRVLVQLAIDGDDLVIRFYEQKAGRSIERRYEQLSGGQRRCVEMAFAPFALSELIFARCGVRVPLLIVDELTTHLGADEKPLVCELLRQLERDTVLVIDHDAAVQGEFDVVYELTAEPTGPVLARST
jgi:DNA repair exonuclease SbcCD ATPase subunit